MLIVGAGLSGIAAAVHLRKQFPHKRIAILEGRDRLGGTWDLFRYPGVRSDSDMTTLGYSFKPWQGERVMAPGHAILQYLHETVAEHGLAPLIRFGQRVVGASWASEHACWTIDIARDGGGERTQLGAHFLFVCGGYYRYEAGHTPDFADVDRFKGRIVHPQQWTPDIEHAGKRIVVIGSGATAVTLVPELARRAAHVTMLQRSPTYVVALPSRDVVALALRRVLPAAIAHPLTRWKNVLLSLLAVTLMRRHPARAKAWLVGRARRALPAGYDVDRHFTPAYKPWEQRMCPLPDGDLFAAINEGRVSVATDEVEAFTPHGLLLQSGRHLEADLVVTATGLDIQLLGGIGLVVDGEPVTLAKTYNYKGVMFSDLPNLATAFGYPRAAWTLKAELASAYVCRLLQHMDKQGLRQATPRNRDPAGTRPDGLDFSPGYVLRALKLFPRQGSKAPWNPPQNVLRDRWSLCHAALDDGVMEFR